MLAILVGNPYAPLILFAAALAVIGITPLVRGIFRKR